jgi:MFS transporter, OPA family, sugar phosphate sensor protein UhpC
MPLAPAIPPRPATTYAPGTTYLTRNSFAFAAPVMLKDKSLGLTLSDVGAISTLLPLAYGASNLLSSVAAAAAAPALLLAASLALTGAANAAFSLGAGPRFFAAAWAANGVFQGLGAPACGRLLSAWFAPEESGLAW